MFYSCTHMDGNSWRQRVKYSWGIEYDKIEEFNVDSKAEYSA